MTEIEAFLHFTASKKEHRAERGEGKGSLSVPTLDRPGRYSSIIIEEEEEEEDAISRTI